MAEKITPVNLQNMRTQGNGFIAGPEWGIQEAARSVDHALETVFALEEAAAQMPTRDQQAIRERTSQILNAAEQRLRAQEMRRGIRQR